MKLVVSIFLFISFFAKVSFAQTDTTLGTYYIHSKIDDECSADIVLTLFKKEMNFDRFNDVVLSHLLKSFYENENSVVNLQNLYENKTVEATNDLVYTIGGSCQFHKNDIYSFIACTYNVCDKNQRSNFEPNMVTLDIKNKKVLSLDDIIDSLKKDSFENYVFHIINRYHIKNIPTCFFASTNPLSVRGSNNVTTMGDTIKTEKGLTNRFYLSDDKLFVYNKATHRDYTFKSVEISFQFYYVKYFLREEIAKRLGL